MIFKRIKLDGSSLILYICLMGILLLQNNYRGKILSQKKNINYFQEEQRLDSKINFQNIIPTFGFNNLKADNLFLSFVQYFGDQTARETTGYSLTPKYFTSLMKYDPNFVSAYLTLANANTMYAGQPEKSITWMAEIVNNSTSKTDSAELYSLLLLYKAYDELLFMGNIEAANYSYKQAQNLLSQHQYISQSKIKSFYFPELKSLTKKSDLIQAQILAWSSVLPHIKDLKTQQKITQKIRSLQIELTQAELNQN